MLSIVSPTLGDPVRLVRLVSWSCALLTYDARNRKKTWLRLVDNPTCTAGWADRQNTVSAGKSFQRCSACLREDFCVCNPPNRRFPPPSRASPIPHAPQYRSVFFDKGCQAAVRLTYCISGMEGICVASSYLDQDDMLETMWLTGPPPINYLLWLFNVARYISNCS